MKRLPIVVSLLAVVLLSASIAYWGMQFFRVEQRPIQAVAAAPEPVPAPDAAATLFGGQAVTAVASNYQLTGVVAAGRDSVAILVADGQPPKALKVGKDLAPGVTVTEVHPRYVMLTEGGVPKRIELATDAKAGASMAPPVPMADMSASNPPPMPPPSEPAPVAPPTPIAPASLQPPGVPPPPPPMQMPAPTRGGQPPTQPPGQ